MRGILQVSQVARLPGQMQKSEATNRMDYGRTWSVVLHLRQALEGQAGRGAEALVY